MSPMGPDEQLEHYFKWGLSDDEIREKVRPWLNRMTLEQYQAWEMKLDDLRHGWDEVAVAYRKCGDRPKQSAVATELGITEQALRDRLRKLGVQHYDYIHVRMKRPQP